MRIPEFPIVVAQRAADAPGEPGASTPSRPASRDRSTATRPARAWTPDPSHPVALVTGTGRQAQVRAANRAARAAGVLPGVHTAARAQACAAHLRLLAWDDVLLEQEDLVILTHLMEHSPGITRAAPGRYWLDARGLRRPEDEQDLLRQIDEALGGLGYLEARLAIASSVTAAEIATALPGPRRRIVPPDPAPPPGHGPDAAFLAPLPLSLLSLPDPLADTLNQLGLETIGELAALPAPALEMRFGAPGLQARSRARGLDPRGPLWGTGPHSRLVEVPLEPPAETLPPLIFATRSALVALLRATCGQRLARIRIHLYLETPESPPLHRDVGLSRPTRRLALLVDRCRAALEAIALPAPVLTLAVELLEISRQHRGEQGDLFQRRFRDEEALDAALARIRARCGTESVVRPVPVDTHRPEADGQWLPDPLPPATPLPPPPPDPMSPLSGDAADTPLKTARRILPEPTPLQTHSAPGARRPAALRLDGHWHAELHTLQEILQSGRWWRQDAWARRLLQVQTRDGVRLLIARAAQHATALPHAENGSEPDATPEPNGMPEADTPWLLLGWED